MAVRSLALSHEPNFRVDAAESIKGSLSTELMTQAVTVVPCGHTFNEDTVIQCLASDKLCPIDRQSIEGYVPNIAENTKDPISNERMTRAVTVIPCGHTFNEDTVIQRLASNKLCPIDEQSITGYIPNYTIRCLAKANGFKPFESLPTEIMLMVFSYLEPKDLGRCSQVSRVWKALAADESLWKAPAAAFGAAKWNTYFGDVGKEPPLPSNIYQIMKSRCPFWERKRVEETHLLVLVPQTVNGKPLNLESLEELVKAPKEGSSTQYQYFNSGQYKDLPASASHWMLMTRDVLPGSRNQSYADQQALVARYAQKAGASYEVPHVLDAAVCTFMEYVQSGNRLYSDNPWTYTRCQEKWNEGWQLVVGGLSPEGLSVGDSQFYVHDSLGIGCSRTF